MPRVLPSFPELRELWGTRRNWEHYGYHLARQIPHRRSLDIARCVRQPRSVVRLGQPLCRDAERDPGARFHRREIPRLRIDERSPRSVRVPRLVARLVRVEYRQSCRARIGSVLARLFAFYAAGRVVRAHRGRGHGHRKRICSQTGDVGGQDRAVFQRQSRRRQAAAPPREIWPRGERRCARLCLHAPSAGRPVGNRLAAPRQIGRDSSRRRFVRDRLCAQAPDRKGRDSRFARRAE